MLIKLKLEISISLSSDVQCGLIHCSGGNKQPFFGPDKDCSKTTFSSNGKEFECK